MKRILSILTFLLFLSVTSFSQDFNTTLKLAQQGDVVAQSQLGRLYEIGKGVDQDYSKAEYWYMMAANQGNIESQTRLGWIYEWGALGYYDDSKMIYWYNKAAEKGYAEAQIELANIYFWGCRSIEKNCTQALYWIRKAAEQGNAEAQDYLGMRYYEGCCVDINYEKAIYWFKKAAQQGYDVAQRHMGNMYEEGKGVKQDYSEAMKWYKKALTDFFAEEDYNRLAKLGYKEAKDPLPPLLTIVDGSLVFKDASNNNQIEVGEHCSVRFKIHNTGKGAAIDSEIRVKLSGSTSGIRVENIKLPNIAVGQTYEANLPITTDINTQEGKVTFTIEVYEPNGWGVAPFDLTVATKAYEAPYLQVVDYTLASTSGTIKKMEPFTLMFNLQNTKYGDAENVRVKINMPTNVFVMDGSPELSFPLVKSGEAKSIKLTLAANNNYPTTNIPITIEIKEKYGKFAKNKQLDIALNQTASSSITIAAKEEPKQERKEIQLATLTADVDRNIPKTDFLNKNTFVLIIANENYQTLASVPYAINDGKIFRQYCEHTLGIPAKNIHAQANATGNQIKAQSNWLSNVVEVFDNPNIIFYYAGHGIPDEASKTAYLLPVDGSGTDVSTGYKLDDLYATLGNMPASQITVFMDACFSGSKREQGMLAEARGVALKAKSGVPQGNMVVFSAAQGDETAYPNREQQHGLFTYYLLKKLQETQGDIALKDLGDYITKQVSQQSLLLNSKKQTPCVTPSVTLGDQWQNWKLK